MVMLMRTRTEQGILILLLITGLGAGIVSGEPNASILTTGDLVRYVTDAGRYLADTGIDTGLDRITTGTEPFTRTNPALSVYDQNGTLLADPILRDEIGKNRINLTDPYGMEVIRLERDIAANTSGFFLYMEPVQIDLLNETEATMFLPRIGYVHPVTDQIWITADVSLQDLVNPDTGAPYLTEMEEYVGKAVEFARDVGKDEANREFNDLNGSFTHGSEYIYAFGMNGTFLASPYYPESIGTDQREVVRSYGVASVADGIELVREKGEGYIAFVILNPETHRPEPKLGYVKKVDDTWFVGSGVYASDMNTGEI